MTDDQQSPITLPLRASPTIATLIAALAKAQGAFPEIEKDKRADIQTKAGARFSYAYADLAAVLAAVRAPLAANELALLQPVSVDGRLVRVSTLLAHSSGEWVATELALPIGEASDARAIASTITYSRRYALVALLALAPADDDDGAAAVAVKPARPAPLNVPNESLRETRSRKSQEIESVNQTIDSNESPAATPPPSSGMPDKSPPPPARRTRPDPDKERITEKQRTYGWTVAREKGWSRDQYRALVLERYGYESTSEVRKSEFDGLLSLLNRGPQPATDAREPGSDDDMQL